MTDGLGDRTSSSARGRRIAVDVGSVRIGVASCDPDGVLATPVETVRRARDGSDLDRLAAIVDEYDAVAVVVGLPTNLAGEHGPAADAVRTFSERLARRVDPVPVMLHDERMTTAIATRRLRAGGTSAKTGRAVIDQVAAVEILQSWLDQRTATTVTNAGSVSPGPGPDLMTHHRDARDLGPSDLGAERRTRR